MLTDMDLQAIQREAMAEDRQVKASKPGPIANAPAPLRALNMLEFARHQFPPRIPLLGKLIHEGDLVMLYAARGVGKTQIAMSISVALAAGRPFLRWQPPKPVKVLYLDGEMAGSVMCDRLAKFVTDDMPESIAINLMIFNPDLLGDDQPLPNLSERLDQLRVEEMLTSDVKLVVVDNISCWVRSGDENDASSWESMASWTLSLRRRGIAVLLVHHEGKKGGSPRGTSKREDLLDLVVNLKRPADYSPSQGATFIWNVTKGRHLFGVDAEDLRVSLETDEDGFFTWDYSGEDVTKEAKMLELHSQQMSNAEIAAAIGCDRSTVYRTLEKHGLTKRRKG